MSMLNKKKTILVACGTGIATSTVVAERVDKIIKENGLNAQVIQCKMAEVASKEKDADLLVTTTMLPKAYSIPVVRAMGYLTGVNTDKIDNEIIEYLKK